MNFKARLLENERIHKRNLEFAHRLENIEPVYGYDDLNANRGMLAHKHVKKQGGSKGRKKKRMGFLLLVLMELHLNKKSSRPLTRPQADQTDASSMRAFSCVMGKPSLE